MVDSTVLAHVVATVSISASTHNKCPNCSHCYDICGIHMGWASGEGVSPPPKTRSGANDESATGTVEELCDRRAPGFQDPTGP